MGHPVIMGWRTWESLPKRPLPGRTNIVLRAENPPSNNLSSDGDPSCGSFPSSCGRVSGALDRPASPDDPILRLRLRLAQDDGRGRLANSSSSDGSIPSSCGRVSGAQDRLAIDSSAAITVAPNLPAAFHLAFAAPGGETVWIIGGESVYRQTIDIADRLEITEVDLRIDGDTYAPDIEGAKWELTTQSPWYESRSGANYRYLTYRRVSSVANRH